VAVETSEIPTSFILSGSLARSPLRRIAQPWILVACCSIPIVERCGGYWWRGRSKSVLFVVGGGGMHYEEKWIEGWLWYRRKLDEPWQRAPSDQMTARMRSALELVVEATNFPDDKRRDAAWLRGALLAARAAALAALGGQTSRESRNSAFGSL